MPGILMSLIGLLLLSAGSIVIIAPYNRYVAAGVIGIGVVAAIIANVT